MKEVFSGEVFEVMPLQNGIIFSYLKDFVNDDIVVAYKMLSFDTGRFTDVAKNMYLITKFGNNYKAALEFCDNYITVKSILLQGGKVFLLAPNGEAQLVDTDGMPIWTGNLCYRSSAPNDIILHNNALWVCYSEKNALLRFNLATMREELRIGGNKSPFDKPRDLFLEGDTVMVSNQGSMKLTQINLNTYNVFDYETFEEPVYQYVKVGDNRFALLKSGLYLI